MTDLYKTLKVNDDSQTHVGFECTSCHIAPIHGARYWCLPCEAHLCQKCESTHARIHTRLKFRFPLEDISSVPQDKRSLVFPGTSRELLCIYSFERLSYFLETTDEIPETFRELDPLFMPSLSSPPSFVPGKYRFFFLHYRYETRSPCISVGSPLAPFIVFFG